VGAFDEAKHFRGYHGRWAKGADRSVDHLGRGRAANAFHPRPTATEARQRKRNFTGRVRELLATRDRVARGEKVDWRAEQNVSWSSPKKIDEQRRKTGDALIPRDQIARKERSFARSISGRSRRTGIKQTFSGKAKVERGNYRDDSRVRRPFDWKHPRKTARPAYVGRRRAEP
jgi:hypothetical protein